MSSALYQTPNLVGLRLSQALTLAAQNQATIKLLCEQEAAGIEPGTIISQKPTSGRVIKKNQAILVTIAKENPLTKAPDFKLKSFKDCLKIAKESDISLKHYSLTYPLGKDICIGQIPKKDTIVPDKKMIIYTAQQKENLYIMPNLVGKNFTTTIAKLQQQQILYKIIDTFGIINPPFSSDLIIAHQKPKAGSFVTLDTAFMVQLEVE
jgi:beta-lactam-binding protein with PASTA domain